MTCGKKYLRDGIRLKKEGLLAVYKHVKRSELLLCFLRTYELLSVRRVEKKGDPLKGDRYLLELVVKYLPNGVNYILAEYVFQPKDLSGPLCYPSGLQWDRTADVYLILTAKNLGRWVHHFIKNVEQIVKETKDEHLHVVIFDFGSPDIDLEQALRKSSLINYHLIVQPGNYSRTLSFGRAVQSIKDPNAIIVTIDMHLDLGSQLINEIRKVSVLFCFTFILFYFIFFYLIFFYFILLYFILFFLFYFIFFYFRGGDKRKLPRVGWRWEGKEVEKARSVKITCVEFLLAPHHERPGPRHFNQRDVCEGSFSN